MRIREKVNLEFFECKHDFFVNCKHDPSTQLQTNQQHISNEMGVGEIAKCDIDIELRVIKLTIKRTSLGVVPVQNLKTPSSVNIL